MPEHKEENREAELPLERAEREIFEELSGLVKAHNWDEALKAAILLQELGIV